VPYKEEEVQRHIDHINDKAFADFEKYQADGEEFKKYKLR